MVRVPVPDLSKLLVPAICPLPLKAYSVVELFTITEVGCTVPDTTTLPLLAASLKVTVSPFKNTSGVPALSQFTVLLAFHRFPFVPDQIKLAAAPLTFMKTEP